MFIFMTLKSVTIVSSIPPFELELVMMFFSKRFHKGIQNFILDLGFCHPCCVVIVVRGGGDNKGENQLLIINKAQEIFTIMFL